MKGTSSEIGRCYKSLSELDAFLPPRRSIENMLARWLLGPTVELAVPDSLRSPPKSAPGLGTTEQFASRRRTMLPFVCHRTCGQLRVRFVSWTNFPGCRSQSVRPLAQLVDDGRCIQRLHRSLHDHGGLLIKPSLLIRGVSGFSGNHHFWSGTSAY